MCHNALLGEAFWPKCKRGVERTKGVCPDGYKRKPTNVSALVSCVLSVFCFLWFVPKVPGTGIEPVRPSLAKGF